MPICEAFSQIEHQPNIYDVVHVKYLDEEPLKLDIVISFPDHGFQLRFDPWSQGLSFAFPIPSQYTDCFHDRDAELPLEFSDGTTTVTCRVSIYDGSTESKVGVGSVMNKASILPLLTGSLYMEEVHAMDVWTDLGCPCGIHQKQVDQMVCFRSLSNSMR